MIWVLLWLFRKYVAALARKEQPEHLAATTDSVLGVDEKKEPIGDGVDDIDAELYKHFSDSDTDMVFALLNSAVARRGGFWASL